jgi:urease subunit alpha
MTCATFLSQVAIDEKLPEKLGLQKLCLPVKKCRGIGKKDLKFNDALPVIDVDPENYHVTADGVPIISKPAKELPLAQRYFMF